MNSLYDVRCLRRLTAVKAIYLLWVRRDWSSLARIGLGREIDETFDAFSLYLPGSRVRTDEQANDLLLALDPKLRNAVIRAADLLIHTYANMYATEIMEDAYERALPSTRKRKR